jgi:hypothetical protein
VRRGGGGHECGGEGVPSKESPAGEVRSSGVGGKGEEDGNNGGSGREAGEVC